MEKINPGNVRLGCNSKVLLSKKVSRQSTKTITWSSLIVGLVVVVASCACTSCGNAVKSTEDQCTADEWHADQLIKDGNLKKAETYLMEAQSKAASSENLLQLPQVMQELADLYIQEEKFPEAEASLRESLVAYARIKKDGTDTGKLLNATKIDKGKTRSLETLARVLALDGKTDEAQKRYKESLDLNTSIGGPVDVSVRIRKRYSKLLRRLHKSDEAADIETEADAATYVSVEIDPRLWKQVGAFDRGEQRADSVRIFKALGRGARRFKKMDLYCQALVYEGLAELSCARDAEAEARFREAVKSIDLIQEVKIFDGRKATALATLAGFLLLHGETPETDMLLKRADKLAPAETGAALYHLIDVCGGRDHCKNALILCDQVEKLVASEKGESKATLKANNGVLMQSLIDTADVLIKQGDSTTAVTLLKRALSAYEQTNKDPNVRVAIVRRLAERYFTLGKIPETESVLIDNLAITKRTTGPESMQTASLTEELALLYQYTKQYSKAENLYKIACAIYCKDKDSGQSLARAAGAAAMVMHEQKKDAAAAQLTKQYLECTEKHFPMQSALFLNQLGLCYRWSGKLALAEKTQRLALKVVQRDYGSESEPTASTFEQLGILYAEEHKNAEAWQCFSQAYAIWHTKLAGKDPAREERIRKAVAQYAKR